MHPAPRIAFACLVLTLLACALGSSPTATPINNISTTTEVLHTQDAQGAQNTALPVPSLPPQETAIAAVQLTATPLPTFTPIATSAVRAPLRSLNAGNKNVFQIAINPRGPWLAAATPLGVQIWNYTTGELVRTLNSPPTGWVMSVAFSGDGQRLAAVSSEQMVWVWETTNWQITDQLQGGGFHTAVALNADGTFVAAAGLDTTIFLWRQAAFMPALGGHTMEVTSLVFTSDSARLLSGSTDGTVRLYNPNDRAFFRSFGYRLDAIMGLALSPKGDTFAAADSNGVVAQWDFNTAQPLARFTANPSGLTALAYLADGTRVLTGARDGAVEVWTLSTGQRSELFREGGPAITSVSLSGDGTVLAAADESGFITLWNVAP